MVETNSEAVSAFWSWWSAVADQAARALEDGPHAVLDERLDAALAAHVRALHPKLGYQIVTASPADSAIGEASTATPPRHRLWLTSKGDPLLRAIAERWRAGAQTNPRWSYHAAAQRRRDTLGTVQVGATTVSLDEVTAAWQMDLEREVLDLDAHHRAFSSLSEAAQARITFAALDALLGEDGVDRWIGHVTFAADEPVAARPIGELIGDVEALAASATGERWAVRRGEVDGSPLVVTFNQALKPIDHVLLDRHARVDVRLRQPDPHGLASKKEAVALEALERELRDELGDMGVLIGRETHRSHRVLHFHVAPNEALLSKLEAFKSRSTDRDVALLVQPDPRWEVLRRWG